MYKYDILQFTRTSEQFFLISASLIPLSYYFSLIETYALGKWQVCFFPFFLGIIELEIEAHVAFGINNFNTIYSKSVEEQRVPWLTGNMMRKKKEFLASSFPCHVVFLAFYKI